MTIVTQTPLRLTLGGGGTDLSAYYQQHGGFIFAAAINRYVTVEAELLPSDNGIRFKFRDAAYAGPLDNLPHPLTREALYMSGISRGVKISSQTDIPTGTGLGSSGAYCAGLLLALHRIKGREPAAGKLAELACRLEMDLLHLPAGKQDPYMAAYGGFRVLDIDPSGDVRVRRARISQEIQTRLNQNLLLFYSGRQRRAATVLSDQNRRILGHHNDALKAMHEIRDIGRDILTDLENNDLSRFGALLDRHWQAKRRVSPKMSDPALDRIYTEARQNGALGGKIAGAGGGGYFAFYVESHHTRFRRRMESAGLKELKYQFAPHGSRVIINCQDKIQKSLTFYP